MPLAETLEAKLENIKIGELTEEIKDETQFRVFRFI